MLIKRIRVDKKDSAYVYAILESLEGYASYSTLDATENKSAGFAGQNYRILELHIPESMAADFEEVFKILRQKVPIIVLEDGE